MRGNGRDLGCAAVEAGSVAAVCVTVTEETGHTLYICGTSLSVLPLKKHKYTRAFHDTQHFQPVVTSFAPISEPDLLWERSHSH